MAGSQRRLRASLDGLAASKIGRQGNEVEIGRGYSYQTSPFP